MAKLPRKTHLGVGGVGALEVVDAATDAAAVGLAEEQNGHEGRAWAVVVLLGEVRGTHRDRRSKPEVVVVLVALNGRDTAAASHVGDPCCGAKTTRQGESIPT